jgi:hypothetical protein
MYPALARDTTGGHVGLANVEARFKSLLAEPGTIAHDVHGVLMEAATKINAMVEEQPVLFSIVQHLEMAAHLTVSSPNLALPAQQAADPTSAATDAAPAEEATTSSATSSTPNSNDSAPTSSSKSKG